METTNFGFVASLLFVGVPTIFLIGLFISTQDGEKSSFYSDSVKVDLDQNADALINALHFCKGIFIVEKKATFKRW